MRKIWSFGLMIVLFSYVIPICYPEYGIEAEEPALLGAWRENAGNSTETVQSVNDLVGKSGEITVCIDGENHTLPLEQYVAGVVSAEISPDFPEAALQAQAVAARTYAVYKQRMGRPAQHAEADVCNDPAHCTAYLDLAVEAAARWGEDAPTYETAIVRAVDATAGQVVTYEGSPIIAVFSAAATDKTEAAVDVWGSEIPYLVSVDSPGGSDCPQYRDEVTYSVAEFREMVAEALPTADLSGTPDTWFTEEVRSPAGGVVSVKLGGAEVQGTAIRSLAKLRSTHYTLSLTPDSLTFSTEGYGHGVGLSQWGARHMAQAGADYAAILQHYYTGTTLTNLSELAV